MNVKMIMLPLCPYCRRASRLIEEIKAENAEYVDIEFTKYNEMTQAKEIGNVDYYHVPTFVYGDEKLYEAQPGDDDDVMRPKLEAMFKRLQELR